MKEHTPQQLCLSAVILIILSTLKDKKETESTNEQVNSVYQTKTITLGCLEATRGSICHMAAMLFTNYDTSHVLTVLPVTTLIVHL